MNFCINCGAKILEEDQKFCVQCGTELKIGNDYQEYSGAKEDKQTFSNYNDYFDNYNTDYDVKQIRTYTLSDQDVDCTTYEKTLDFLSNKLLNEREGHFHYNRPIRINGRTLILFKYKGELIAKGIFSKAVKREVKSEGDDYSGYYQVEQGSVEIFNSAIDLDTINRYFPVKSLRRDQIFDEKYHDDIFKMIKDFTKYR